MLTETTRNEIKKHLIDWFLDTQFGDGLEREYVTDGVTIKGVNEYTDEELIEEYESSFEEDDLSIRAKQEMTMNRLDIKK